METITKFYTPGMGLLLTLAFGFWLSNSGRPYNGILFNIHKLIALGIVILTVIQVSRLLKIVNSPAVILALLVVAALCVIALFASGALMSLNKLDYMLVLTVHRIAPAVMVLAMGAAIYLVNTMGSLLPK